jgi:hypothetical protein
MTDPYLLLGSELTAAAERQATHHGARGALRAWLSRHLNTTAVAAVFLLGGGAAAVAATGVLNGAPVKPEVTLSPISGNGLPLQPAAHLTLRAADPAGGLQWGLRVLRTTRGQVCAQVGRIDDGQLGELGLDSAFGSDGRFHVLPADVLPPGYGGASGQIECVAAGQTMIFVDTAADRSAVRLLPEEFKEPPGKHRDIPPTRDLRVLAYGLLGQHAVSVTYRTPAGLQTSPVRGPDGAFLIVEPAGYIKSSSVVGDSFSGEAGPGSVPTIGAPGARSASIVSAATFRFGARLCSQGSGAPVRLSCPIHHHVLPPRRWFSPTRSLHARVGLTLLPQARAACDAAFLKYPCYKGQIRFTAPYAVTTAGSDYEIESVSKCNIGGRPEAGWGLERDVKRDEPIQTVSLGLFVFTPSCAATEKFEVRYLNQHGPSATAPHESVIVGVVTMSQATFPGGAPVAAGGAARSPG